jgi:hypothetical protein
MILVIYDEQEIFIQLIMTKSRQIRMCSAQMCLLLQFKVIVSNTESICMCTCINVAWWFIPPVGV